MGRTGHYPAQSKTCRLPFKLLRRVSDRKQLTDEQLEWSTHAPLLRLQRWDELAKSVIQHMRKTAKDPTWQYWLGRSFAAQGKTANEMYEKTAASAAISTP